jgi:hypothetical protein
MTELTTILNSAHKINDSLQRRRKLLSVDTSIESDCSAQVDMTELTPIPNSVLTFNDSLHRRLILLRVVTIIESDCSVQDDMTEVTPILNSVQKFNDSFRDDACNSAWLQEEKVIVARKVT